MTSGIPNPQNMDGSATLVPVTLKEIHRLIQTSVADPAIFSGSGSYCPKFTSSVCTDTSTVSVRYGMPDAIFIPPEVVFVMVQEVN